MVIRLPPYVTGCSDKANRRADDEKIISVICLTGAIIVFQDEIKEAINADIRHVEDKGEGRYLTDEALVDAIRRHAGEGLTLKSVQMPSDAEEPAYAQFAERGHQKLAFNPYTGELIGWEKESTLVNTAKRLHRYLLNVPSEPHEGMSVGRFIVGVTAICMTLILLTGIVTWWPHNKKMLKNRMKVSTDKGFRRFVYDSHVSLGIYGVVFLLLMSLTGPSWSFHWYRQGAMTVLGGDVSNMEHHGQFERQQQAAYWRMGWSAGQDHLFPCCHHRCLAPLERLLHVVETDSYTEETINEKIIHKKSHDESVIIKRKCQ